MLAASLSFAQAPGPRGPRGQHDPIAMLTSRLNLTADQAAQAKTIFDQARTSSDPIRAQLDTLHSSVDAAVKANDQSKIVTLATNIGALEGQLQAIHLQAQAKLYALLTPAQQQLFDNQGPGRGWGGPGPMRQGNH